MPIYVNNTKHDNWLRNVLGYGLKGGYDLVGKQARFIFAFANYLGRIAFSYEMAVGGHLNAKENHRRYDEWKVSVLMGLFDIVSVHSASVDELEGKQHGGGPGKRRCSLQDPFLSLSLDHGGTNFFLHGIPLGFPPHVEFVGRIKSIFTTCLMGLHLCKGAGSSLMIYHSSLQGVGGCLREKELWR